MQHWCYKWSVKILAVYLACKQKYYCHRLCQGRKENDLFALLFKFHMMVIRGVVWICELEEHEIFEAQDRCRSLEVYCWEESLAASEIRLEVRNSCRYTAFKWADKRRAC